MKSIIKIGPLACSFFLIFVACSKDGGEVKTFPVTYSYNEENSCTTGLVTSHSKISLCKNLLDNQLNNYCAPQRRNAMYESNNCSSAFGLADN